MNKGTKLRLVYLLLKLRVLLAMIWIKYRYRHVRIQMGKRYYADNGEEL